MLGSPQQILNRHRERQQNNNMGSVKYLLAFARYYPYGPHYFIFGGFFQVGVVVPEIIGGRRAGQRRKTVSVQHGFVHGNDSAAVGRSSRRTGR